MQLDQKESAESQSDFPNQSRKPCILPIFSRIEWGYKCSLLNSLSDSPPIGSSPTKEKKVANSF